MSNDPRPLALGLVSLVCAGACASKSPVEAEVTAGLQVVLPTDSLSPSPDELVASVMVPLLPRADQPTRFLACQDLLERRLPLLIDPEHLGDAPYGVVLEQRQPWGGDSTPNLFRPWPTIPVDPVGNPWGAAVIYLEARGLAQNRRGQDTPTTQLVGCTCVRTQDATHPDPVLDAAVKAQCPLPEVTPRLVLLQPTVDGGWSLKHARATTLVAPEGQAMVPGAVAKVLPPTPEHQLAGRVVHFSVDLGSGPGPWTAAVTDEEGIAAFRPTLQGCGPGARVLARLGAFDDPPLVFELRCVPGVGSLVCADSFPQPSSDTFFEVVQRGAGRTPWLATLANDPASPIRVIDPQRGYVAMAQGPNEFPANLYSYRLEVNADAASSGRPMLASVWGLGGAPKVVVHELDPDQWTLTEVATLDETCATWTCGSGTSCDPLHPCVPNEACVLGTCQRVGAPARGCPLPSDPPPSVAGCGCAWAFDFGARPILTSGDLDGDGLADLLVGGNLSSSLIAYRAQADGGPLYRNQTCNCGTYGPPPGTVTPGRYRVADGPLELAIGSRSGLGLVAQDPERGLICRSPDYVGPERVFDVLQARLGCTPALDPSCPPYQDLVLSSSGIGAGNRTTVVLPGGPGRLGEPWLPEEAPDLEGLFFGNLGGVGDFNGDGHDDVLALNGDFDGTLVFRVWLGAGNGALGLIELTPGACADYCVSRTARVADMDGDGRDDLLLFCPLAPNGPEITVFRSVP